MLPNIIFSRNNCGHDGINSCLLIRDDDRGHEKHDDEEEDDDGVVVFVDVVEVDVFFIFVFELNFNSY